MLEGTAWVTQTRVAVIIKRSSDTSEINILKCLQGCPYVAPLYHSLVSPSVYLMVQKQLVSRVPSVGDTLQFLDNVLQGLRYIHQRHIIHGDISPNNILYDEDKQLWIIVDFNHAVQCPDFGYDGLGTVGTEGFQAPEILAGKPYHFYADIWSFGAVVKHFFQSLSHPDSVQAVL
jgi:serine/threonine protein kinase